MVLLVQKRNVKGLVALIDKINTSAGSLAPRAIFGCLESAIEGAGSPNVPAVNTTRKHLSLILGDKDEYPDESLVIPIQAQKAVQKATNKSMGKMRRGAWNKSLKDGTGSSRNGKDKMKGKKRRTREDSDEEDDEEDEEDDEEDRTTYHAPGTVITQKVRIFGLCRVLRS